ncbi:Z1 domain-containing protein [Euryarchaeota archaeon]|nr:Z1 domain-containing protein [Euryarchaeota archaeon]
MPINHVINEIVEGAVQYFTAPGPLRGKAQSCVNFMIELYSQTTPESSLSQQSIEEIWHRFRHLTTFPPEISDEEIEERTHTDTTIDGSWYDDIESFPKWEEICDNWVNGHASGRMPNTAIRNIDKYTDHIFQHSNDPVGSEYIWKGLVVGNVQSGKTATYTGLVGKAIDVGYRVILIMSGRMNSLRYQTEARITDQVVGRDNENSIDIDDYLIQLTTLAMNGDFGQSSDQVNDAESIANTMRSSEKMCLIAVVKKHYSPLERFRNHVQEVIDIYPEFRNLPFLVIDDEMDEAGVNTGGEDTPGDENVEEEVNQFPVTEDTIEIQEREQPSTTNQKITKLLKSEYFNRRMYIGFTATPYAVLAHRRRAEDSEEYREYGPDIFPDNYLLVLDDPESYCGGDVFIGRTEVIVRDMYIENGRPISGEEILRLPEYGGVEGVIQIIPSRECCDNCAEQTDAEGRLTHGPRIRQRSHCRRYNPGIHQPIVRGAAPCQCACHTLDEVHKIVPPYEDIIPADDEEDIYFDYAEITPSLSQAIDDFILSGAARAERGDGEKPCTMMINVSRRWAVHRDIRNKVLQHVETISNYFETPGFDTVFLDRLERRWNESFSPLVNAFNGNGDDGPEEVILSGGGRSSDYPIRVLAASSDSGDARPARSISFDSIRPYIRPFIMEIRNPNNHRILNSHTNDVIDFDQEPSLKAIVHGGWNLGRGLTFKGLVSAYMLRGHGDMSGLMQMQRWCGYRGEYGGERILDLMRIYITEDQRDIFQRMLSIERKNRYLLGEYLRQGRSPNEFASVLEQDPDKPLMSAAKSGSIRKVGDLLSGRSKTQITFDFNRNEDEKLFGNRETLSEFISRIETFANSTTSPPGFMYQNVPTEHINWLIERWNIFDSDKFKLNVHQWVQRLMDWNDSHPGEIQQLTHWTIFIPSRNSVIEVDPVGGHVAGFDASIPITLNSGMEIYPYPYPLDSTLAGDNLKMPFTNSTPGYRYQELDSQIFFGNQARPETHGLLIISPVIHPFNRNFSGGQYGKTNPCPPVTDEYMHRAGDWPHLLSIGMWFPTTNVLTTEFIQHGDVGND